MPHFLDPSTSSGTVILPLVSAALSSLVTWAWLRGPIGWFYQGRRLRKIVTSGREFRFFYGSSAGQNKIVTFDKNGEIGKGRNNQEHVWRIRRGKLEILAEDGLLYSRFGFDPDSGRLAHTNDPDCRSVLGQYFEPEFEPLAQKALRSC